MASACIVHTHLGAAPRGNHTTSVRWQQILEALGWDVVLMPEWDGSPTDMLIALHARRSHRSIVEFKKRMPEHPLVVAATGTDIYNDDPDRSLAHESFGLADRIILLQPMALEELPAPERSKGRVIYQSMQARAPVQRPADGYFDVAFLANARSVKDPLTVLRAAQRLSPDSRVRILHMGSTMDSELGAEIDAIAANLPHFSSLGSLPQATALERLAASDLALSSSRHEGGANVVTEALALGVPLLVSDIPGSLGLLGADYPGVFHVGDDAQLAGRLKQVSTDPNALRSLQEACRKRAFIADPKLELESFRQLMQELGAS